MILSSPVLSALRVSMLLLVRPRIEELLHCSHGGDGGNFAHVDEVGSGKSGAVAIERDEGGRRVGLSGDTVVLGIAALEMTYTRAIRRRRDRDRCSWCRCRPSLW